MSEAVVDDIVAVLPPLLQSLEALWFVARHLHPPDFDRVMQAAGTPDQALQSVRARLERLAGRILAIGTALQTASDAALAAFGGLRMVHNGHGDITPFSRRCAMRRARRKRSIRWSQNCRRSASSFSRLRCARTPPCWSGLPRRHEKPASSTTTTSPAAAAAFRSTCRNTIRRIARGRW